MTELEILVAHNMQNAEYVLAAAALNGVPFWIAAALVEKESMGRNIYGNDTGGVYSSSDPERPDPNEVTEENFALFQERVLAGETSNGVGPAQITHPSFIQDAKDHGFDLADPLTNITYGLSLLSDYLGGETSDEAIRNAGTKYNGAEIYGWDLLVKAKIWRSRFYPEEYPYPMSDNGFVNMDDYPGAAGTFTSPGTGMKQVYVRNDRAFAVLFEAVAKYWNENVEPIAASDPCNWFKPDERNGKDEEGNWDAIGIHGYRPPGSTTGIGDRSNHRSGTAIDINGHKHPYEASTEGEWDSGFTQAQIDSLFHMRNTFTDASGNRVLRLGLEFQPGWRDGMHVEVHYDTNVQEVHEAAKKLENYVGRSSQYHVWWKGAKGWDVHEFQQLAASKGFNITAVDGICGPNTDGVIYEVQKALGVTEDGRVGNQTRAALQDYIIPIPEPEPVLEPMVPGERIAGEDRFDTAVEISKKAFPTRGVELVYLVGTGTDELSLAGSFMASGPVLTVAKGAEHLDPVVEAEIERLAPSRVVVLGGYEVVTTTAFHEARRAARRGRDTYRL